MRGAKKSLKLILGMMAACSFLFAACTPSNNGNGNGNGNQSENGGNASLSAVQQAAISEITEEFNKLDIDNYSKARWDKFVDSLNNTIYNIKTANDSQVETLKNTLITQFKTVKTAEQCVENTPFDFTSGEYEFDQDDEGHILIQYRTYPGRWVYVGTKDLQMNFPAYDTFTVTVKNTKSTSMKVNLKLGDDADSNPYEEETGVTTIQGGTTRTFTVKVTQAVSRLYFFVDSTEEHTRSGELAILNYSFYKDSTVSIEPKTIAMNNVAVSNTTSISHTLTSEDNASSIGRISTMIKVNYNGNGSGNRYFGIDFLAGENAKYGYGDTTAHVQDNDTFAYVIFTMEVSSTNKLTTNDTVSCKINYAAPGLTFEVVNYIFYYTSWPTIVSETINVNKVIYSAQYDNTNAQINVSNPETIINYSNFANKGVPTKMEIKFTHTNPANYTKSQIHLNGFPITNYPSGTNDLFNTAAIMGKETNLENKPLNQLTGVTTTGTIVLYPITRINLAAGGQLEFCCWWTPATRVIIDSITLYTEAT